ncbi:hypothetical protein [Streptomyces sp900116325]|uniref:hypothetical protein n=1 Tax=Streptomyces sp. 900116325 TaxID=3154295 RepID=UPI0034088BF7
MESDTQTATPPDGPVRFVATFYQAESGWRLAAEAPSRGPVDYAAAEMIRTMQSRGQAPIVEIWGPAPNGTDWQRIEALAPGAGAGPVVEASEERHQHSAREERLLDRRNQVLTSALARAGLSVTQPVDDAAVARMVDVLDEETVRSVARWLSQANRQ